MNVKLEGFDEFKNYLNKLEKDLTTTKELHVGVFGKSDSQLVEIATIHEFGGTIKPKNVKWLTIPIVKEAKGKSAREFKDLVFIPTKNNALLAKVTGKGKDKKVVPYYLLKKEVKIPERSFIRSTFNDKAKMDKIFRKASKILANILDGKCIYEKGS